MSIRGIINRKQKRADLRAKIEALSWEIKKLGPTVNVHSQAYQTLFQQREELRHQLNHT